MLRFVLLVAVTLQMSAESRALAAELYDSGDTALHWDNTVTYGTAFRLSNPDRALLTNSNADDADRNFRPGLISNRVDLLSEFNLSDGSLHFDVSAAAWYDSVYNHSDSNDSPATFNPVISETRPPVL